MSRFLVAASTVGTLIEWYDFFIYASVSPYIAAKFFPQHDPAAGMLYTWLVFATGFVVRPLGAALFGHLGDRVGRKATFLATLVLMGLSTFAIGLIPTYSEIGVTAPLLLTIFRMLQGVSLGGEFGGAVTYVLEHAPPGRRAFYVGFIAATPPLGLALSSLTIVFTSYFMPRAVFGDWGWRTPFLISIVLTVLGLYLRLKLAETPMFESLRDSGKISRLPLLEAFTKYPRYILLGVAITAGHSVLAYTSTGYIFPFLTQVVKLDAVATNAAVGIAAMLQFPFYVLNAYLADRIGRRPVYLAGLVMGLLTYYPIYSWLTVTKDLSLITAAVFLLILATAFTFSVLSTTMAELFPTPVRYTGMAVSFNIGIGLFGGFTTSIVQYIGMALGNPLAGVVFYTYAVAFFALATAYFLLPETAGRELQ
ncbi:MAG: MFS transporter [Pyrobaculum sp.]